MKPLSRVSVTIVLVLTAFISTAAGRSPNIVVVMADDIGLGDLSFYQKQRPGAKITVNTPNLDRLISEGIRFSDAHSPASLCAPTRFSMLTGNYPYRNHSPFGVWTPWTNSGIDPKFTTSARIAKAGGYLTAFFGKWGLGSVWKKKEADWNKLDQGALHFGFDYACELPQGIQNDPYAFYENGAWMKLKPDSVIKKISAEQTGYYRSYKHIDRGGIGDSNWDPTQAGPILASKAVEFISRHKAEHNEKPFFIYYCSQAVHIPHEPPKELDGVKVAGETASRHGDMIVELDTQVGMLIKALKKNDLYNDTLFIFTSDNGGLGWDKHMTKAGHKASNGLRGAKGAIFEGGHRVPFIAVWPGKIKADSECHEPIVGFDVVATIAELARQPLDRKVIKDAINLIPLFKGQSPKQRHSHLVHQSKAGKKDACYAIREGEWKLIMRTKGAKNLNTLAPVALFNLEKNLSEKEEHNLIKNPEQAARVQTMMKKYRQIRTAGDPTIH